MLGGIPDKDRAYLEGLASEWDLFYLRSYQAVLAAENVALDYNLRNVETTDPYRVADFVLLSGQSFYVRVQNDEEFLADVLVTKGAEPVPYVGDRGPQPNLASSALDAVPPPMEESDLLRGYRWHDLTQRRAAIFAHWMELVAGWKTLGMAPENRWSVGVTMDSNYDLQLLCYDAEGAPVLSISAKPGDDCIEEVLYAPQGPSED